MATSARRTPIPDMTACLFLIVGGTLGFAVLRALYTTASVKTALAQGGAWAIPMVVCGIVAYGLFVRKSWALPGAIVTLLVMFVAALSKFHVPETAELPTGLLSLLCTVLLVSSRREFQAS